eukprot:5624360-Pyramimonas_sp.AAC.1
MADAAEPAAAGSEEVKLAVCSSCGRGDLPASAMLSVQEADPFTGKKAQFRCSPCSGLRQRLLRIQKSTTMHVAGWGDLSKETKTEFMANARGLAGDELARKMQETVTQVQINQKFMKRSAKGKFRNIADAAKDYVDKPEEWNNIPANAPRQIHDYSKAEQIWIPEYEMEVGAGVEEREEKCRRMGDWPTGNA